MDLSTLSPYLQDPIFFAAFLSGAVVLGLVGSISILRAALHAHSKASKAFHKIILLVKVPKEKKR